MHHLIENTEAALNDLEGRGMLAAYAAQAAGETLLENWRAVVHDGGDTANLVSDIDDTIAELLELKKLITSREARTWK